jgi:hypothetical protein
MNGHGLIAGEGTSAALSGRSASSMSSIWADPWTESGSDLDS